jgi:hypothetical protein
VLSSASGKSLNSSAISCLRFKIKLVVEKSETFALSAAHHHRQTLCMVGVLCFSPVLMHNRMSCALLSCWST